MRVYTGRNQTCPQPEWWGETSTEFAGAEDIHLDKSLKAINDALAGVRSLETGVRSQESGAVYDLQGRRVTNSLRRGIYIRNGKKFVVK